MSKKAEHIDGWLSLTELAAAASTTRASAYLFLRYHALPVQQFEGCVYVRADDPNVQAYVAGRGDHRKRDIDRVMSLGPLRPRPIKERKSTHPPAPEGFIRIADLARMAGVSNTSARAYVRRCFAGHARFLPLDDPRIVAYLAPRVRNRVRNTTEQKVTP